MGVNQKVAVIDMGSNTIRMVIFQMNELTYHLIDDTKETVRLSENMGPEQTIKPAAMERALSALARFMKICRSRSVDTIIPVATAAVRQAKNQAEYLERVKQETQLAFRVLSGHEEGYYGFLGVINGLTQPAGFTLDIGGGSSEVTYFAERQLANTVSMPFGALTLTEQFRDPAPAGEGKLLLADIRQYLYGAISSNEWIGDKTGVPLIGLGGTVRNIARIHRELIQYPLESAHQYVMTKAQVDETMAFIAQLSVKELQALPGLSKDRADIIVAGGLIIQTLMEVSGAPELIISGNGLREGLFFEHYYQVHGSEAFGDPLELDVQNTMRYYGVQIEHAKHVAHLSVRLFDELAAIHGLGERERLLLRIAAHLHNVGVAVSFYEWQKHTFYVLLHTKIVGLTHRERLMVALVAAHRSKKKVREMTVPYQQLLRPEDEDVIAKLSVILMMARAMDRSLSSHIQDVSCEQKEGKVKIVVYSVDPDIRLELKEAGELQQKFVKAFGCEYSLKTKLTTDRRQ
ncbi:Ppx/GppA phosphatase family protein [Brevibacillus fluminis]|uniref:Ppx/GppA phosphatase family protein n=1 Tax=Brevibacillus fluminis TaxID=511487 RepID=UPI003F8A7B74